TAMTSKKPFNRVWVAEFVGRFVAKHMRELEQRIAALESAQHLEYRGVYNRHDRYRCGEFVTKNGSLWHCNVDAPKTAPGSGSREWTLAVKRGKDAKRTAAEAAEIEERILRGEVLRG